MCEPSPAVAGSKVPFVAFIMPVPLQLPPDVAALRLKAGAPTHTEGGCVMVAFSVLFTVTSAVSEPPQAPEVVYVIVNVPVPEVAGSKVPFVALVIPVPLQVPPPVAAVRLKAAALAQTGLTFVIVGSADGPTVTVATAVLEQPVVVPVTV